ncbi:hypothetical protein ACFYWF_31610 [Streptomyces sp. NPDC003344]|uniref:hypothetical protein n=1 Tax=Streptomyces sp. NPDC003344 TaxID=3364682 RepID=UPI0036A21174
MARIDASNLTTAQLDGVACVVCAGEDGAMVPVDVVDGCQVFAHRACLPTEPADDPAPVLVVGSVATPADVERLRHVAWNVAYELGTRAVFALHNDYRVTDFAAVYLAGDVASLRDASTLVLVGEALAVGMDVHEPLTVEESVTCDCGLVHHFTRPDVDESGDVWCAECRGESACTWCFEWNDTEDLEIVEEGDAWVPLHAGCRDRLRRSTSTSLLPATV